MQFSSSHTLCVDKHYCKVFLHNKKKLKVKIYEAFLLLTNSPLLFDTIMGLAYLGLSSAQGSPPLTEEDVMKRLAASLVAQKLIGTTREYAMLFLILMAVMSTGSAEVIAIASIVIYEVYQVYICLFKPDLREGQCILCLKYLRKQKKRDDTIVRSSTSIVKPHFTCETHKDYKEY